LPVHNVDVVEGGDKADETLNIDEGDIGNEFFDVGVGSQVDDDVVGHQEGAHEEEGINRVGRTTEYLARKGLGHTCQP